MILTLANEKSTVLDYIGMSANSVLLWKTPVTKQTSNRVFINSPQHTSANIAKFVLAVPSEMNMTNEVFTLEM